MACGKRKLKDWNCTKGRKTKISKCVGMWFNAMGSKFKFRHARCLHDHATGHVVCRQSFILELIRERDSIIIYLVAYRTAALLLSLLPYFTLLFPFNLFAFLFTSLFLPSCLVKTNLNSHSKNILRQFQILSLPKSNWLSSKLF